MVCKFGFDNELLERTVRFGTQFDKPSAKDMRKHRAKKGERLFSADEIRDLIDDASPQVRAMILLGINCGFGNSDVAELEIVNVKLDEAWIEFPRPKTGMFRKCPLWPETVEALRSFKRPMPLDKADDGLMFLTKYGTKWVRTNGPNRTPIDSLSGEFGKLLRKLDTEGRQGLGFYTLRHTFRTIADATKDQPATRLIMGHVDGSIDATYRERIDEDRLLAVTNYVRAWLFSKHDQHVRAWKHLNKKAGGAQ
jgi:integrase